MGDSSRFFVPCCVMLCSMFLICTPRSSWAHGVAGKRFFPTTLAVDDPFVSDEFSLLLNHIEEPEQETTEFSFEYSKRITEYFGIGFGDTARIIKPHGENTQRGFGDLEVGAKYQFFTSEPYETVLSVALDVEIGGTGNREVDADSFSTFSPALFFGQGFGELPDSLKYLKPLAITGAVGPNFPSRSENVVFNVDPRTGDVEREVEKNPVTMSWGFTLQYNLQYLQSYVHDVGLPAPFDRMVLLVEFPFESCLNLGCEGDVTGYVNPGIIWVGKYMQFGIEGQFPVNDETGQDVGVLALFHLFIDDLFPRSLGRPIFK